MEKRMNNSFFITILKGTAISFIFTIIALTIFSLLLVYTDMNENLMQPVVIGTTGISILLGSFIANRKLHKNGIFNGCIISLLYIIIIYFISSISNNMNFSLNIGSAIMILLGLICGAVGGILGINI